MSLSDGDLDQLSAYLDGRLSASESAALERRLDAEAQLRQALADMRAARALLRALPTLRAPRDFTLTRAQARRPPLLLIVSPVVSAVSAAAAVVLLVAGALLALTPSATLRQSQVAQMPTETAPAASAPLPTATTASVTMDGLDAAQSSAAQQQTAVMQRSAEDAPAADSTAIIPLGTATMEQTALADPLFSAEPMNAMPAAVPETAGSIASEVSGDPASGAADAIAESAPGAGDGADVMMFAATQPSTMAMMAQPTASPLPTQAPTRTASPLPTQPPTATAAPTEIAQAQSPTAETSVETEAAPRESPPTDSSAALLIALGVALALLSLTTIILRRRARQSGP